MKIYTMPNNSNTFINNTNNSGNQMFIVDANVTSSSFLPPISVGGGNGVVNVKQRLTIGEPIQLINGGQKSQNIKLITDVNKKKTRRRLIIHK
jgi:hypothetical protein